MKTLRIIVPIFLSLILAVSCAKENLEVSLDFSEESLEMVVGEEFDLMSVLKVENSSKKPGFREPECEGRFGIVIRYCHCSGCW